MFMSATALPAKVSQNLDRKKLSIKNLLKSTNSFKLFSGDQKQLDITPLYILQVHNNAFFE